MAQAAVADVAEPQDRARLMGLLGAAFGVGFVAGPAIVAVGALVGPRVPFYLAAAIAGVNALVAVRRLPETHGPRATVAPAGEAAIDDVAADQEAADEAARPMRWRWRPSWSGPAPSTVPSPAPRSTSASRPEPSGGPGAAGCPGSTRQALVRLLVVAFVGMVAFSGFEATFSLLTKSRFGLGEAGTGAVFTAIGLGLVVVQGGLIGRVADRLGEGGTLRAGPGRQRGGPGGAGRGRGLGHPGAGSGPAGGGPGL